MGNGATIDLYTPENPMSPYFSLKLDSEVFDLDVNFLKSLRFDRTVDDFGTFEIEVEDTMDLSLEAKLWSMMLDNEKQISFQYGWFNGARSEWHFGIMTDYIPTFHSNTSMTIKIVGEIVAEETVKQIIAFKGKSISDIVRQVCANEGWNLVDIDETDKFSEEREFVQSNVKSMKFIREKLEPEATCDGTPVQFYLESDAEGTKAYFVKVDKYSSVVKENYNFMINAGNYGSVISFSPSYNGTNIMMEARETFGFIDIDTNEVSVYNASAAAASKQDEEISIYGSTSPDKMRQLISNRWYEKNIGSYEATMVIVGNPNIKAMDYINIMPFRPDGTIHHTGGTYMVTSVLDEIKESFISTLSLVKANTPEGGTMPFSELAEFGGDE